LLSSSRSAYAFCRN